MSKPILFLHIGISKTGSSAIQLYCIEKQEQLLSEGLYYPDIDDCFHNALENQSTSGNAHSLALICIKYKDHRKRLKKFINIWLDNLLKCTTKSKFDALLLSCETLSALDKKQWNVLKNAIKKFFDLRVILFNREPYQWMFSSWLQVVKKNGAMGWFGEGDWSRDLLPLIITKSLGNDLIKKTIQLSYDECKDNIICEFFKAIGYPIQNNNSTRYKHINLSLNSQQITILLLLNRYTGGDPYLNKFLLGNISNIFNSSTSNSFYFYDPNIDEKLDNFLKSNKVRRHLSCKRLEPVITSEESWYQDQIIQANILKEVFNVLRNYHLKRHVNMIDRAFNLSKLCAKSLFRDMVPNDFDVMAYLLLNNDVLSAGIDPYEHYALMGINEAREFCWPFDNAV